MKRYAIWIPFIILFNQAGQELISRARLEALLDGAAGISFTPEEVSSVAREIKGRSAEELNQLGIDHARGLNGKSKDYRKAAALFMVAAELDHPDAQSRLGFMYHQGMGVLLNYKEAAFWFQKAADQGSPKGQFNLGLMYILGLGVGKNRETGLDWLRKSARQDYKDAREALKDLGETW